MIRQGGSNAAGTFNLRSKLLRTAGVITPCSMYYTYVLQSQKDKSLYIGYTSDLQKRFKQHNAGESQATKPFRPYTLIHYEAFLNKSDAKNREIYLKSRYGRRSIKALLKEFLSS